MSKYLFLYKRLKSVGVFSFVPIFMVFILLPLLICLLYVMGYEMESAFYISSMYIVPLGSIWWIILLFKSYVESKDREIYYFNKKNKSAEAVLLSLIYTAMVIVVYGIGYLITKMEYMLSLSIIMMILIYMFGGVCFFLIYLTHSTVIPYVLLLAYTLYSVAPFYGDAYFMQYSMIGLGYLDFDMLITLLPYLSVMAISYILGVLLNDVYCDYY